MGMFLNIMYCTSILEYIGDYFNWYMISEGKTGEWKNLMGDGKRCGIGGGGEEQIVNVDIKHRRYDASDGAIRYF